ncbi:molybdopterin molybdotransferase MoeA [Parasulfitobacter algicola]|uniref:Molybdopterin molybdenumtransferase n=1 Tax=Parasulfitobacter algicola TaxID=2614809 RepID=A0ABX2IYJ7_9RHOB|nr:gephyrin-like molybdotransferase Glp [Sulfitobacter algicola]NSX55686.1 molybdopterin molybdotransferase MoeA [Sulfitobacter algicola]
MITVDEALAKVFELADPLDVEHVPLASAAGRVLAQPVKAQRSQPPFASSAMDGYAVQNADIAEGATLQVIGEAAAGHAFSGQINAGETVRIFTGAPIPKGADRVIIQEDVTRAEGHITIDQNVDKSFHIRDLGVDFKAGDILQSPRRLRPADVALLASMNIGQVPVTRKPVVALIATGDELVMPCEVPRDDQIIASNTFGLKAMIEATGATARLLPIARDTESSLKTAFDLAQGADVIVTIGGASVGDHDLVGKVAQDLGLDRAFYKIAMRPGKPLMAGRLRDAAMIGLPGNPVSSIVCGHLFLLPLLRKMLGLPAQPAARQKMPLADDLPANGPREHYMRACIMDTGVTAFDSQDSSRLRVLSEADALICRPIHDPARQMGDLVDVILLE